MTKSLSKTIEDASKLLACLVVPLYIDFAGKPSLVGSGFFVSHKGSHFLISAAHVLDELKTKRIYFYIRPSVTQALAGKLLLNISKGPRDKDPIDIGVLQLQGGRSPPYPDVQKYAMDFSYLTPSNARRAGKRYVLVGFPETRSKVNPVRRQVTTEPLVHLSRSIPEAAYSETGHDPSTHIVLSFDKKRSFDLEGNQHTIPKPHGISGSPIFELYSDDGESSDRVFPVVGMVTSWLPQKRRLIGTDSQFLRRQIERAAA